MNNENFKLPVCEAYYKLAKEEQMQRKLIVKMMRFILKTVGVSELLKLMATD